MIKRLALVSAIIVACIPAGASGQTRDSLIRAARAAYADFRAPQAIELLTTALNPATAPDSAWGYAAHFLAQIQIENGNRAFATTWLRWSLRTSPSTRLDSITFGSGVAGVFRAARDSVRPSPGDPFVRTTWTWPVRGSTDQQARVSIQSTDAAVPLQVLVTGRGLIQRGEASTLPYGTYEFEGRAAGYVSSRVTREVLPGVTTVLTFNLRSNALAALDSILPTDVSATAQRRAVRVTPRLYGVGQPSCGSGFLVGPGLVLTTYRAIRGADSITVELSGGQRMTDAVRIAAYNLVEDLALLHVPGAPADSLVAGAAVAQDQYLWAVGFPGCTTATATRFRATSGPSGTTGGFALSATLAEGQRGAALIDRAGAVVAIGTMGQNGLTIARAQALLTQGRANVTGNTTSSTLEVAIRENHRYGTLVLTAPAAGSKVRLQGLETWHWPELNRDTTAVPLTFAAARGRYRAELFLGGQLRGQTDVTITAGTAANINLEQQIARATQPPGGQIAPARGKKFPWPIAIIGLAGAGGAAAFLLKGGGPPPGGDTSFGGIHVRVPVNP